MRAVRLPLLLSLAAYALVACKEPTPTMDFTPVDSAMSTAPGAGGVNFDAPVELAPHMRRIAGAGGQCNIERVNGAGFTGAPLKVPKDATLRVVGWAVDDRKQSVPETVELRFVLGERTWKVSVPVDVPRKDVQALLGGSQAFARTGHATELDVSGLPAGAYRMYTAFQRDGATYACDNGRVVELTP